MVQVAEDVALLEYEFCFSPTPLLAYPEHTLGNVDEAKVEAAGVLLEQQSEYEFDLVNSTPVVLLQLFTDNVRNNLCVMQCKYLRRIVNGVSTGTAQAV